MCDGNYFLPQPLPDSPYTCTLSLLVPCLLPEAGMQQAHPQSTLSNCINARATKVGVESCLHLLFTGQVVLHLCAATPGFCGPGNGRVASLCLPPSSLYFLFAPRQKRFVFTGFWVKH